MAERGYSTPAAFRRSLTDRLRNTATQGRWTLPQLQRQMAYDRLLERLYLVDREWIVKGATALLARNIGVRGTIDIDLYRAVAADSAERELRSATSTDIGDWFRFDIGPAQSVHGAGSDVRLPVTAYIGPTEWAKFHVDLLGSGISMTDEPDDVAPLTQVTMPGVEQHGYRAYPLVDHVADKVVATFDRYGESEMPSTRYKDLVDLVAIVTQAAIDAALQQLALSSEADRREVTLPDRFHVPAPELWEPGYHREAKRSLLPTAHTIDEAVEVVRPFLDPLLNASATGRWDPRQQRWKR